MEMKAKRVKKMAVISYYILCVSFVSFTLYEKMRLIAKTRPTLAKIKAKANILQREKKWSIINVISVSVCRLVP